MEEMDYFEPPNMLEEDADFYECDELDLQDDYIFYEVDAAEEMEEIDFFEPNILEEDADLHECDEFILQDDDIFNEENCAEERDDIGSLENNTLHEDIEHRWNIPGANADFQEGKHCAEEEDQEASLQIKLKNVSGANADFEEGKHCAEEEDQEAFLQIELKNVSGANADFEEGKHCAEEEDQEDSLRIKLKNVSGANADFQEGKYCAEEEDVEASLRIKLNNVSGANADFQEGKYCAEEEDVEASLRIKLNNVSGANADFQEGKYCVEEEDVEASLRIKLKNVSGANDDDNKPSCSGINITEGNQCNVIGKRKSIIMQPRQIINEDFVDEEEDGARCLENNIIEPNAMDDNECTNILIISNKIMEMFPDVEETYLLRLCFEYNRLGANIIEAVSEILMRDDYPKNIQLQQYYVAKLREILPSDDDELLNYLASNIKTDEHFINFMNEMYETEIKEPNPLEVTEVEEELLLNCPCCFEEDLKIDAMVDCSNGCYACTNCVVNNMGITYGQGSVSMSCLSDCGGKYTIDQLEDFMNPTMFAGIERLLQQREIEEANINDLHRCPFCDYAAIVEEVIFNCTECGKDSCILCQKEPHPALLCNQVEDDDDVRKRTFVENQMSEALYRMCPKCKVKIIKEAGCNKMTCRCGSMMCYVCKAIVSEDYSHFNGQGGTNYHLCPLYNDTEEMHAANVRDRAEEAMKEVGGNLKIDPTV